MKRRYSSFIKRLTSGKEYREAFVASQIKIGIPFQVRALRTKKAWSQEQLATAANMLQPRISSIETVGGNLRLDTLQRIAAAFDIALVVRFVPFSDLVRWADDFSPDDFAVADFGSDPMFSDEDPKDNIRSLFGHYINSDSVYADMAVVEESPALHVAIDAPTLTNVDVKNATAVGYQMAVAA